MISPPNCVLIELKSLIEEMVSYENRTIISSSEFMERISGNATTYPGITSWLSGNSERTKKRYLSIALAAVGIGIYQQGHGFRSQRIWKLGGES